MRTVGNRQLVEAVEQGSSAPFVNREIPRPRVLFDLERGKRGELGEDRARARRGRLYRRDSTSEVRGPTRYPTRKPVIA